MEETAKALKTQNVSDIATKAEQTAAEIKEYKNKIDELSSEIAKLKTGDLLSGAKQVKGVLLVTARLDGMSADELRAAGDVLRDKEENLVCVLAGANDGKVALCAVCGKQAVKNGFNAGKIIKQIAAITGGGGGGRPDGATAGGKDISKIDEAVSKCEEIL
jgi:alanyl-tRNA synthetase